MFNPWLSFSLQAGPPWVGSAFEMAAWGVTVVTTDLPWWYVPGQLIARLPEGFLLLLAAGVVCGVAAAVGFVSVTFDAFRQGGATTLRDAALRLARSRRRLLIWGSVVLPIGFIIVQHSTLYDGIRHVLFIIPMLALIAAAGCLRLLPFARRIPVAATATCGDLCGFLDLAARRPASARVRRH
jgi:hypothetical protein